MRETMLVLLFINQSMTDVFFWSLIQCVFHVSAKDVYATRTIRIGVDCTLSLIVLGDLPSLLCDRLFLRYQQLAQRCATDTCSTCLCTAVEKGGIERWGRGRRRGIMKSRDSLTIEVYAMCMALSSSQPSSFLPTAFRNRKVPSYQL